MLYSVYTNIYDKKQKVEELLLVAVVGPNFGLRSGS